MHAPLQRGGLADQALSVGKKITYRALLRCTFISFEFFKQRAEYK